MLRRLKEDIGETPIVELTKQELVAFGRRRAKEGADVIDLQEVKGGAT